MSPEEFKLMCERLPTPKIIFTQNPQFGFELRFDNGETVIVKPVIDDSDAPALDYQLQLL